MNEVLRQGVGRASLLELAQHGSIYVSLHMGSPVDQADLEIHYEGYARQALPEGSVTFGPGDSYVSRPYRVEFQVPPLVGELPWVTYVGFGLCAAGPGRLFSYSSIPRGVRLEQGATLCLEGGLLCGEGFPEQDAPVPPIPLAGRRRIFTPGSRTIRFRRGVGDA